MTTIYLQEISTNNPKRFQKSFVCETGLSDCYKLVATIFRSTFSTFIKFALCIYKAKDPDNKLTNILYNTLEKHAPLKSKTVRGNQAPFMSKELSKAIMEKSRLRNRHLKYPSRENVLAYKNIKNM